MKKIFYPLLVLLSGFYACNDEDRQAASATSDSDIDAARNFIQAALVGDFEKAKTYMLNDSLSLQDLNAIARLNERLSKEEKEKYGITDGLIRMSVGIENVQDILNDLQQALG